MEWDGPNTFKIPSKIKTNIWQLNAHCTFLYKSSKMSKDNTMNSHVLQYEVIYSFFMSMFSFLCWQIVYDTTWILKEISYPPCMLCLEYTVSQFLSYVQSIFQIVAYLCNRWFLQAKTMYIEITLSFSSVQILPSLILNALIWNWVEKLI